jgi:hypothetical protein
VLRFSISRKSFYFNLFVFLLASGMVDKQKQQKVDFEQKTADVENNK